MLVEAGQAHSNPSYKLCTSEGLQQYIGKLLITILVLVSVLADCFYFLVSISSILTFNIGNVGHISGYPTVL